jgi:hypothetical protein
LGKPQYEEKFELYEKDDINIYLRKEMQIHNNGIHIFLRKFLWVKELAVDGIRMNY